MEQNVYEVVKGLCKVGKIVTPVDVNDRGQARRLYVLTLESTDENYDKFAAAVDEKCKGLDRFVAVLRLTLCDAAGNPIIKTDEDAQMLRGMPLGWLTLLATKAIHNNIGKLEEDDEGN